MTVAGVTLGGRLPLYDREALEPAQKELFDWLMNKAVPWAEGAGFQAGIEGGQLIGPFNPALLTRPSRRRSWNLGSSSTKTPH